MPSEMKKKISKGMIGKQNSKGIKWSEEALKNRSEGMIKSHQRLGEEYFNRPKGEDHWNWQGGIHKGFTKTSTKWKNWRESVFSRDDWTCQNSECKFCENKRGVYLHPHHIKRKKDYPDLCYEVDNGITYCKEYHMKSGLHRRDKCINL